MTWTIPHIFHNDPLTKKQNSPSHSLSNIAEGNPDVFIPHNALNENMIVFLKKVKV